MSSPKTFVKALRDFYNDVGAKYDSKQAGGWHRSDTDFLISTAGSNVQEGSHILDLATGTGNIALAAANKVGSSGKVLGIDLSEGLLAHARKQVSEAGVDSFVEFICQNTADLPLLPPAEYKPQSFNAVFCASAIMLLPDPALLIRRIATRYMHPQGVIVANAYSSLLGAVFFSVAEKQRVKTVMNPAWAIAPETALRRVFEDAGMVVREVICEDRAAGDVKWDVSTLEARGKLWERVVVGAPWVSFGLREGEGEGKEEGISEWRMEQLKMAWEEEVLALAGGSEDGCIVDNVKHFVAVAINKEEGK